MAGKRQSAIAGAVTRFIPRAPFYDAASIRAQAAKPHLRHLPPEKAAWLSIIAYIRHVYTDYDALRDEGYDSEAARFFVHAAINRTLQQWHCSRLLIITEDAPAPAAMKD